MQHGVSTADRVRGHIDELFAQDKTLPEILEDVARLGAQLLMQAALEAEITEFLGQHRYQQAAAFQDARPGSRNGYREVTVKTTAGPVQLARPKLRGTTEAFASRLFGSYVTKANALESLVIASFVRGLPVRDVEAALAGALGDQAAISKSTVSAICGHLKDEYEAWARRDLDGITLDYLFLDALFFRMPPGSPAEPVLAAWGITTDGKPAFIGLAPAPASPPAPGTTSWPISTRMIASLSRTQRGECRSGGPDYADLSAIYAAATSGFSGQVGITFTGRGTSWPRSPPGCRPRSRTPTGSSSAPRT